MPAHDTGKGDKHQVVASFGAGVSSYMEVGTDVRLECPRTPYPPPNPFLSLKI